MDATAPSRLIDWDLAVRTGRSLAGQGPEVDPWEARECVMNLHDHAAHAVYLVGEFTGMDVDERTAPVLVVDRTGWIQANADGFRAVIAPLVEKLQEKGRPSAVAEAIGSRITGLELGAMFGFLGGKVLGQFDPFYGLDHPASEPLTLGRTLLVAPNIVQAERELDVDPNDFRLWVAVHEETHRLQFTAVPWMRDHLHGELASVIGAVRTDTVELISEMPKRVGDLIGGRSDGSLLDLLSSPEQRAVIERVTGVMSLLEGHADVVMDGVGPEVIPSVRQLRKRFNQRRKGVGTLDRVLRRLLGLDQKMAQYRDGAVFVRAVVDKVGMDDFNAVWDEPANLPTKAEIHEPESWIRRVHG
jgi:coenzyme F420 biosynthesis associated uncharacterized protein